MIIHPSKFHATRTDLAFEVSASDVTRSLDDAGEGYRSVHQSLAFEGEVLRTDDGITIDGHFRLPYRLTCSRCAVDRERFENVTVHWVLLPQHALNDAHYRAHEMIELSTDDLDVSYFEDDAVDLGALIREAILLFLDHSAECGEEGCDDRLTELLKTQREAQTSEDDIDPRWARLADLKSTLKN